MTYTNPNALVETSWLADHLDDPKVIILDASWHLPTVDRDAKAEFQQRHIPNARFFDIDDASDRASALPHMLPSPDGFADYVSALGIGNDSHVVVYDSYGLFSAARVWWMFRVFGHDNVSILNGGLPKWETETRPLTDAPTASSQHPFNAVFRPKMVQSIDDIQDNLTHGQRKILDARSLARFRGEAAEPRPGIRSGHIPGSACLPFDQLLDPASKTLLPAETIEQLFDGAGIDNQMAVTCSCGTGVTACALALGLHLIGNDDVAVYDGSWTEWGGRSDTPVEV